VTYLAFDGQRRIGELVVHQAFARPVTQVFERLYEARWPIARMRLVDAYRGYDDRSMAANNTSGYNCRTVAGTHRWSAHAYGAAIDINPVQNPYVTATSTAPAAGARFAALDRSRGAHMPRGAICAGDVVVRAFARIGWEWGGDWSTAKDYQHFSATLPAGRSAFLRSKVGKNQTR
jgi:poly-gamma-glutamate synthesis protein (capsule biosynthesis protein)